MCVDVDDIITITYTQQFAERSSPAGIQRGHKGSQVLHVERETIPKGYPQQNVLLQLGNDSLQSFATIKTLHAAFARAPFGCWWLWRRRRGNPPWRKWRRNFQYRRRIWKQCKQKHDFNTSYGCLHNDSKGVFVYTHIFVSTKRLYTRIYTRIRTPHTHTWTVCRYTHMHVYKH